MAESFPKLATSIPDVQDALFAALRDSEDRPILNGLPVPVDLGGPFVVKPDHVWISGKVEEPETDYDVCGMREFEERYTLVIRIQSTLATAKYVTVRDRVKAIAAWAQGVVTSDPFLSGACDQAAVSVGQWEEAAPDDKHRAVGVTLNVRISATVS